MQVAATKCKCSNRIPAEGYAEIIPSITMRMKGYSTSIRLFYVTRSIVKAIAAVGLGQAQRASVALTCAIRNLVAYDIFHNDNFVYYEDKLIENGLEEALIEFLDLITTCDYRFLTILTDDKLDDASQASVARSFQGMIMHVSKSMRDMQSKNYMPTMRSKEAIKVLAAASEI